jgi:hypothetical protein
MAKVWLRCTNSKSPVNPYMLVSDYSNKVFQRELGQIWVSFMMLEEGFVVGCGQQFSTGYILGTVRDSKDLTQKVYDYAKDYGQRLARSIPQSEFIDETGGPIEVKFSTLGPAFFTLS